MHTILPEYRGRVRLRIRPFPLEVADGEAAPRDILEQEWWLAALQEPQARFAPFQGDEWPATTLPAFEAVWCATEQNEAGLFRFTALPYKVDPETKAMRLQEIDPKQLFLSGRYHACRRRGPLSQKSAVLSTS